jgi:hypothetical protein
MVYGRGNKPIPIPIAFQIDIDHVHSVMRLTVKVEIVTLEVAEDIYSELTLLSRKGGPWAAIYDLSAAKDTTIPVEIVRGYARRRPSVPMGKPHVVVGEAPAIFGLARIFQMCREHLHGRFDIVSSLEEAYKIVDVRPEDFTVGISYALRT